MRKFLSRIIFQLIAPHLDQYLEERDRLQAREALRRSFPMHSDEQLSELARMDVPLEGEAASAEASSRPESPPPVAKSPSRWNACGALRVTDRADASDHTAGET